MKKNKGIHFYINVVNYQEIVENDEFDGKRQPIHAIHALSTFFSAVESYALSRDYNKMLTIEKITGARLHIYIVGDPEAVYALFFKVVNFAYRFSIEMTTNIGKYKLLKPFSINVGASYGRFYDYDFSHDGIEEMTTIGHACNYAAKLQADTKPVYVSVDEDIYGALPDEGKSVFDIIKAEQFEVYGHGVYYTAELSRISDLYKEREVSFETAIKEAVKRANDTDLGDISFSGIRQQLNFQNLTLTECKDIEGIPFFADVRGFTKQFKEDDSNLEEMAEKTRNILETMYDTVKSCSGVHIQFQGDREFAIFHDYEDHNSCVDAVLAGMRLIDFVNDIAVGVGVGESKGRMYATKIGARGNKDNIVLGAVVNEADKLEDKYAGENQVAISREVYDYLQKNHSVLAKQFNRNGEYYITTYGYKYYQRSEIAAAQLKDKQQKNYNGAWSCDG